MTDHDSFTPEYATAGADNWRAVGGTGPTVWLDALCAASVAVRCGFWARVIFAPTGEIVAAMVPPVADPERVAARVAIVAD